MLGTDKAVQLGNQHQFTVVRGFQTGIVVPVETVIGRIDMEFAAIKDKARELFHEAGFISHISSDAEYEQALALMDQLVDDYDNQRPLIEVLAVAIERWENTAPEFAEFNERIAKLDSGTFCFEKKGS